MRLRHSLAALTVGWIGLASCSGAAYRSSGPAPPPPGPPVASPSATNATLPAMPPALDPHDVYAADRAGHLSPAVAGFAPRVYVPNSVSDTVDVIDPATLNVVDHFAVGRLPQHVVPSYDLKTLWVTNDASNSLTPIDPATATAKPGAPIPVDDPYNLYFTPDGREAIVVAERLRRLDFRDPHTMALHKSLSVPCNGVDHMDFSADGRFLVASCEFGARLIKVDVATEELDTTVDLDKGTSPQDVKLSPDGATFWVADRTRGGVYAIDAAQFRPRAFVATGRDAHGLYVSRDSRFLYVTNRGEGTVSVIDFSAAEVVATWRIPGGSPDMGGVSADGATFWVAGRYNREVYAIDIPTGRLRSRVAVGEQPHGLCVYPQPGRYSLGHTGVFR